MLRRLRLAAGLSQQELAERADLSARNISDLERGVRRRPHPATARRLADGLGLEDGDRARLLDARADQSDESHINPALESLRARTRLPHELTQFVGREAALQEVASRLDEAPLVTIAGPGGAGKTRLAVRLAHQRLETDVYPDGVVLVELAPLPDERFVARIIADSLGVPDTRGQPLVDVLVRTLQPKQLLLILDNCEHVLDATAAITAELLRNCRHIRILATSREPLHLVGEVVYRIPPMHVPVDDRLESLAESEAARLFVLRARAANSQFLLTEVNASAVAEICRRLDGLPLAIELAAARVAAFAPADIAARLDDALSAVAGGPRSAPVRHQTLEATLTWSYALLGDDERALFRRLAVFAGGFSLPAAQSISPDNIPVIDVLARLAAKSMIQVEPQSDGGVRYRALEPLRQFGHARLAEADEVAQTRGLHAEYILSLCEAVSRDADWGGVFLRWRELNHEADNIRVALEWAAQSEDTELGLRLAAALWVFWTRPDRQARGRLWLKRLLEMPNTERYPDLRSRVVVGLAYLSMLQSEMAEAVSLLEDLERVSHGQGDDAFRAIALSVHGTAQTYLGDLEAAEPLLHESVRLARLARLPWIEMVSVGTRAALALTRGDLKTAETELRTSLRIADDPWSKGMALNNLGDLMRARGEGARARRVYEDAWRLFESLDPDGKFIPQGLVHNLGYVELARGNVPQATELFLQAADIYRAVGADRRGLAECIIGLACTAVRARQAVLAAHLYGSADAEFERLGTLLTPANRAEYERGEAGLKAALDARQLAIERGFGRELSLEYMLEEARQELRNTLARPSAARQGAAASLTEREYEVASLVARGLTNRQVATELVVTEKTVKNHVQHVLEKLGVRSRAELAARAQAMGIQTEV
jgi:predicted ATPase/DNA-binding CsgD family transcriptional regulator